MKRHTHVGVYGLIQEQGQSLFILKSRGPYVGLLDLPGGEAEFGETPIQTLAREVLEETGLRVKQATLLDVVTNRAQYCNSDGEIEDFYHIGVIYIVTDYCGQVLTEADGQDSLGAHWAGKADCAVERLTPFAQEALARITVSNH